MKDEDIQRKAGLFILVLFLIIVPVTSLNAYWSPALTWVNSSVAVDDGDFQAKLYTIAQGGSAIWSSGTDCDNSIQDGRLYCHLGNETGNRLTQLEQGQEYWWEYYAAASGETKELVPVDNDGDGTADANRWGPWISPIGTVGATALGTANITGSFIAENAITEWHTLSSYVVTNGTKPMTANLDLDGWKIDDFGGGTSQTGTPMTFTAATGQDVVFEMGDVGGVNEITFKDGDSPTVEVASIDSDGTCTAVEFVGGGSGITGIVSSGITDGTIVNADISATADIVPTKLDLSAQRFDNILFNGGFEAPVSTTVNTFQGGWYWTSTDSGNWDQVEWQTTTTHTGNYAVRLSSTASDPNPTSNAYRYQRWDEGTSYYDWEFERYKGKALTYGCWVNCDTASAGRLSIYDAVGQTHSDYHTGGSSWEYLSVTRTIDASATMISTYLYNDKTAGASDCYYDSCHLLEGTTAPETWIPGTITCFPTNHATDILAATSGDVAKTDIDLSAVGIPIPANVIGVQVQVKVRTDEVDCVLRLDAGDGEDISFRDVGASDIAGLYESAVLYFNVGKDQEIQYTVIESDSDNDVVYQVEIIGWCVKGGI